MTPATVLVTGANGFLGTELCRVLAERGYRVIAGVRATADTSSIRVLPVELRFGDVCKPDSLAEMVRGVDFVVHNAGIVKAKRSEDFFAVNEGGTSNLAEAISRENPNLKRLVYVSSLAAAGPSSGTPLKENDQPRPITTYGKSKLAGEEVLREFSKKIHTLIVRPAGIYGPGDKEIFRLFQSVHRGWKPLIGDTKRKLQLVHVKDVARAVVCGMEANTESGHAYFIAESKAYTAEEMMTLLQRITGRSGVALRIPAGLFWLIGGLAEVFMTLLGKTPMITREKVGELLASWEVDTSKAEKELGFAATISFAQGAKETYEWYVRNGWLN